MTRKRVALQHLDAAAPACNLVSAMPVRFLRCLLVALIAFGFFAGTTGQAMPLPMLRSIASVISPGSLPCDQMAAMAALDGHASTSGVPCKPVAPDCMRQMTCLQASALPERPEHAYQPVAYERLVYWSGTHIPSGLDLEPDLFPPIVG